MRILSIAFLTVMGILAGACRGQAPAASGMHGQSESVRELAWSDLPAPPTSAAPSSPVNLTASDGTGLELVTFDARAAIEGPLAFTELRLEFENPSSRTMEGTFSIALPPSAKVHRFAMRMNASLVEGEIVEDQKARQTFDALLHRRIDPALLEREQGNRFKARVFPILPKQRKEIILAYSEVLKSSHDAYRLPLRGLPTLDALGVRVSVTGERSTRTFHLARDLVTPDRDFVLPSADDASAPAVLRAGNFAVVRVATPTQGRPDPISDMTVLVDTSASRSGDLGAEVAELRGILRELAKRGDPQVHVVGFDQEVTEFHRGPASSFDDRSAGSIVARGAAGATDIARALAELAITRPRRVLVLTDALSTAGSNAAADLARTATSAGVERLDVALVGTARDEKAAIGMVASGSRTGSLLEPGALPAETVGRLVVGTASPVRIRVPGSNFYFPEMVPAAQAGEETIVFAELTRPGPVGVSVNDREQSFATAVAGSEPLLRRILAGAKIDKLAEDYEKSGDQDIRDRIRRRVVSLSREHGMLGPFTSFLVLETEQDYARFGIDRTTPNEFLTIGESGAVELGAHTRVFPGGNGNPSGTVPRAAPTVDSDQDGIPDARDRCPNAPETYNGYLDEDGCPDKAKIILERGDMVILEHIVFRPGSAKVLPESIPLVDATADFLRHHPELLRVEVAGYGDSIGGPIQNQRLSEDRARAVASLLVVRGVLPTRLVVMGYGNRCPLTSNGSELDRAKNRRVEFKVLETEDGPTGVQRCKEGHEVVVTKLGDALAKRLATAAASPVRDPALGALPALDGDLAKIRALLDTARTDDALRESLAHRDRNPKDELAWIALGDSYLGAGDPARAARAYGSLLDLGSASAEKRRGAGGLLEAVAHRASHTAIASRALELAVDAYRVALELRPDHPSSHRLLAFALARQGKFEDAFTVLERAYATSFRPSFVSVRALIGADLALVAAAWANRDSESKAITSARLKALDIAWPSLPSGRFVVTWESDASDVDLYVKAGGAVLWSGGGTARNSRDGYGPEYLALPDAASLPARIGVKLVRAGPQGYALGKVDIVYSDAQGRMTFDERPFVLMRENGYADLGDYRAEK